MNNTQLIKLHNHELAILNEFCRVCDKFGLNYFLLGGSLLGAVRHKGFIPWDDDLDVGMQRDDYEKFLNICINNNELNDNFFIDYYYNNPNYRNPFAKIRMKNTIFDEKGVVNKRDGIWIDIFPIDNINSINKAKKQKKIIIKINSITSLMCGYDYEYLKKFGFLKKIFSLIPLQKYCKFREKIMELQNCKKNTLFANFGSKYDILKQIHDINEYYPLINIEFEGKLYKAPRNYDYVLKKIYGDNYMELPPVEKRVTHNPLLIKFSDGEVIDFRKETVYEKVNETT